MKRPDVLLAAGAGVLALVLVWLLFFALPRWTAPAQVEDVEAAPETAAAPREQAQADPATPRIKARLFYVSEDGRHLVPVEREVEFGEGTAQQARRIVEAQLAPAPGSRISAIPEGTTLKEVFVTVRGHAYVDLSAEIATGHSGGSLDEILTVYTIVNALTQNLPAVTDVQILIDGSEVDTLAGHVDLRRPLRADTSWLQGADTDD